MTQMTIVQFSDIHFRVGSNPVEDRVEPLLAAIGSIRPQSQTCLVLVTGDVAFSGKIAEYDRAVVFFSRLREVLQTQFGQTNVIFDFIPGNHDCLQPEDELGVRGAVVAGARERVLVKTPDTGYINALLQPQRDYFGFVEKFTGRQIVGNARICRSDRLDLAGRAIQVVAINTALLSQRQEQIGTLAVPTAFLDGLPVIDSDVDVTVCMHHHPDNWLEPGFRRDLQYCPIHIIENDSPGTRDSRSRPGSSNRGNEQIHCCFGLQVLVGVEIEPEHSSHRFRNSTRQLRAARTFIPTKVQGPSSAESGMQAVFEQRTVKHHFRH